MSDPNLRRCDMAIHDRKLADGTKLWAKYKGEIYTAEVRETEVNVTYRLSDGREFKSPSAAGSAVMNGHACNGWTFWTVGDPEDPSGPVRRTAATRSETSSVHPAPKPTRKGRSARTGNGDGATTDRDAIVSGVECGDCGAVFPTQEEALTHMETAHREEPTA
jgi:hypothetical protein